jgi:hypothetical protein
MRKTNTNGLYSVFMLFLLVAVLTAPDALASQRPDYVCGVCDFTDDGIFSNNDAEQLAQCIFSSGINECLNTDINEDGEVSAADITACVLCSEDMSAFGNCGGCDFNRNGRIDDEEPEKVGECIFVENINQCYNRDANLDGAINAADASYCALHCGEYKLGDVDLNGVVNENDALMIEVYLEIPGGLTDQQLLI